MAKKANLNSIETVTAKASDKMMERIRKQHKWHEQVSSVPSIPPKNQVLYVPEDDEDVELPQQNAKVLNINPQSSGFTLEEIVFGG